MKRMIAKRHYSIGEAQQLIPQVARILRKTMALDKALDLLGSIEIEVYDDDYATLKKITKLNKQFHKLSFDFFVSLERLEEMGCIIKDLDAGVVDFPSVHDGKKIFLCWHISEKKIQFWHGHEDSFMQRKPLFELNKKR